MVRLQVEHLSEEERLQVLSVIQRDFDLRQSEQHRLSKLSSEVSTESSRTEALAKQREFNASHCIHCYKSFFFIINPKETCATCNLNVCRKCSKFDSQKKKYVCKLCQDAVAVKEKSCDWFYESVTKRFKHFGSAKVVRSLLKPKSSAKSDTEDGPDGAFLSASTRGRSSRPTLQAVFSNVNESKLNSDGSLKSALERLPPEQVDEFRLLIGACVTDMRRDIQASLPPVTSSVDEEEAEGQESNARNQLQTAYGLRLQSLVSFLHLSLQNTIKDPMTDVETTSSSKAEIKHSILREIEKLLGSPVDMPWDEVTSDFFSEDELCSDPLQKAFEQQLSEAIINKVWHTACSERVELRRRLRQSPERSERRSSAPSEGEEPMSLAGSSRTASLTRIPEEDSSGAEVMPPHREFNDVEEEVLEVPNDAEILQNMDFFKQHRQAAVLPGLQHNDLFADPDALSLGSRALEPEDTSGSRLSLAQEPEASSTATEESDLEAELAERERLKSRKRNNWFMQIQKVSPYDNCGSRLVGKDLGDPVTMHVPRGLPCSPRVGQKRAEALSDLSENESSESGSSDESGVSDAEAEGAQVLEARLPRMMREMRRNHPRSRTSELVASGMFLMPGEQPSRPREPTKDMIRALARRRTEGQTFVENSDELKFSLAPGCLSVMEGETARFTCQLEGVGNKDVFWFKEVTTEGHMRLLEDSDKYSLESSTDGASCAVFSVCPTDSARYMCVVVSEKGQCSCSMPLVVQQATPGATRETSVPEFLVLPASTHLREGDSARFSCRVTGNPAPRLLWFRGDKRISKTDRCRIERVTAGAETLHVDYALLADGSEYTVQASSNGGTIKHKFRIDVNKRSASDSEPESFAQLTRRLERTQRSTHHVTRSMADSAARREASEKLRRVTNVADACLVDTLTEIHRSPGEVTSLRKSRYVEPEIKLRSKLPPRPDPLEPYRGIGEKKGPVKFDKEFVKVLKGENSRQPGQQSFSEFEREYCATQANREEQRLKLEARKRERTAEEFILGSKGQKEIQQRKEMEQDFVQLQDLGAVSADKFSRRAGGPVMKPVDTSRYGRDFVVPASPTSPQNRHWEVRVPYGSGSTSPGQRNSNHVNDVLKDQVFVAQSAATNVSRDLQQLEDSLKQPQNASQLKELEVHVARAVANVEENEDVLRSVERRYTDRSSTVDVPCSQLSGLPHDLSHDSGLGELADVAPELPSVAKLKDKYRVTDGHQGFSRVGSNWEEQI